MEIIYNTGIVEERQSKYTQQIHYTLKGRNFRTSLNYDPYPHQSYIRLEIWVEAHGWKEIYYDQSMFFRLSKNESYTPRLEVVTSRFKEWQEHMVSLSIKYC